MILVIGGCRCITSHNKICIKVQPSCQIIYYAAKIYNVIMLYDQSHLDRT